MVGISQMYLRNPTHNIDTHTHFVFNINSSSGVGSGIIIGYYNVLVFVVVLNHTFLTLFTHKTHTHKTATW